MFRVEGPGAYILYHDPLHLSTTDAHQLQMARLATEWKLPEVKQNDWVESQRPGQDLLSWHKTWHEAGDDNRRHRAQADSQRPGHRRVDIGEGGNKARGEMNNISMTGMPVPNFRTARMLTSAPGWQLFYESCFEGKLEKVCSILAADQSVLDLFAADHRDELGRTVLHVASAGGNLEIVRYLAVTRSDLEHQHTGLRNHAWAELSDSNNWT